MKRMLLIYGDPARWAAMSEEGRAEVLRRHAALVEELTASGELLGGAGLADATDTTTVRMRDGVPEAMDGPFADAKDQVSAYYLIECATTERAIALAARLLDPHVAAVEVRPIVDTAGGGRDHSVGRVR